MNSANTGARLLWKGRLFHWLVLSVMLAVLAIPPKLIGGICSVSGNAGWCRNLGYPVTLISTTTQNGSAGDCNYTTFIRAYKIDCCCCTTGPCEEVSDVHWRNEPQGPPIGDKRQVILDLIRGRIRQKVLIKPNGGEKEHFHIRTPSAVCGVRGSLGGQFFGLDLLENSPDGLVFTAVLSAADISSGQFVSFEVERKGDEDWLELAVNNTVFFKQSLADSTTNQWYELEVPANLLAVGANTFTYFLNSAGDANSQVFFPMSERENAEAWCGGLVLTNSTASLDFSNLVIGFDYAVEQSTNLATINWQSILTFTATNDLQTVTVPATNTSSMFYRAALSLP